MIKHIHIDITPFKIFLGKVCYGVETEWFLVDNYDANKYREIMERYYAILETTRAIDINYDNLFLFFSLLKTAFARRKPLHHGLLTNIKVVERSNKNGRYIIKVEYTFE